MNKLIHEPTTNDLNSLINSSTLVEALGNKPEQIKKFLLLFLASSKEGLEEINKALNKTDLKSASDIGHRIKSAAQTVGAFDFAELCYQLEQLKHDGDIQTAKVVFTKMQSMLSSIENQITEKQE